MLHSSEDSNQKYNTKINNIYGGEKVWLKIWYAIWMWMRKLQNTKQSIKANTTISALQDVKNPSKQTPKNTSVETHRVTIVVAIKTTANSLFT
jgi:hypothetical protein